MFQIFILGFPLMFASIFNFFGGETSPFEKNLEQMNKVINISTNQLNSRYGIVAVGRGGSEKDDKSSSESISFHLDQKPTKDQARILIIEIVELFLHNINSNKEINVFLYNNPFTYKNLEIRIFIFENDHSDVYHPNLGLVSLTPRGTISFVTYEQSEICKRATWLEESYEEAYKIATGRDYPGPFPKASTDL